MRAPILTAAHVALFAAAALLPAARATLTVLSGAGAGTAVRNGDPRELAVTYAVSGRLVPVELVGGCVLADDAPRALGPDLAFIVLDEALGAGGCEAIEDIVLNNAAALGASAYVFTQATLFGSIPGGYYDPVGNPATYRDLGLAITIVYLGPADKDLLEQLVTDATAASQYLNVTVASYAGDYPAFAQTQLVLAGRIIAYIVFCSIDLYCVVVLALVLVRHGRAFPLNTSTFILICMVVFASLNVAASVNYAGLFQILPPGMHAALSYISFIFGLAALLELLHAWTSVLVRARNLPTYLLLAYRIFAVVMMIVTIVALAFTAATVIERRVNGVLRAQIITFPLMGAFVFVLVVVFFLAGVSLLILLRRVQLAADAAKTAMIRKITVLIIIATAAMIIILSQIILISQRKISNLTAGIQQLIVQTIFIGTLAAAILTALRFRLFERTGSSAVQGSYSETAQTVALGSSDLVKRDGSRAASPGATRSGHLTDDLIMQTIADLSYRQPDADAIEQ